MISLGCIVWLSMHTTPRTNWTALIQTSSNAHNTSLSLSHFHCVKTLEDEAACRAPH